MSRNPLRARLLLPVMLALVVLNTVGMMYSGATGAEGGAW